MRAVVDTPGALVEDGRVKFGTFSEPIRDVNLLDAQPWRIPAPRAVRAARLKEWQAFQFSNGRYFVAVALFDAKVLALAQIKIYDRQTRSKVEFERQLPTWALSPPKGLLDSRFEWVDWCGSGAAIRFENRLNVGSVTLNIDVPAGFDNPAIRGRVTARVDGSEPQVVSIPFGANRGMYSHKACLAMQGELFVGDQRIGFEPASSFLFIDDHKGYYPYVMRWDWLVGGGVDEGGRGIGFNLTRNASIDPERFNENCLWLAGERHLLPPVTFQRSTAGGIEVWRVRDARGQVEVDFQVELDSTVRINAFVVESRYRGPFGRVRGSVLGPRGERVVLDDMIAMGEDFYLRC
jgi:hypothetical protein